MSFYLLLVLGWFGAAMAAALVMGRFIAAGKGELGADAELAATDIRSAGTAKADRAGAVRAGKREAA